MTIIIKKRRLLTADVTGIVTREREKRLCPNREMETSSAG